MRELTVENAREYLIERGWLGPDEHATIEPLGWGVSNVVLKVSSERGKIVLKQPHRRLRVQQPWFSRLERIFQEAAAMRIMARVLPAGAVPRIVFEDRDNYVLAMSCAAEPHTVWKKELLEGRVDEEVGRTVATHLALLHRETLLSPEARDAVGDRTMFVELRVEPFYWRLKPLYPELAGVIDATTEALERHILTFVHADYSPKNMLIHAAGVTYVDHETAHFGDPAFDVGFFHSHLALKAVKASPDQRAAYLDLLRTCYETYVSELRRGRQTATAARTQLYETPIRALAHFCLCCLARLDGASPVDYLNEEDKRDFVRMVMKEALLARHKPELPRLFETLAAAP